MKQAIILFTALVLSFAGFAQFPGGGMPPAQGKGMQAPPSIGIVFGKVVDSAGKPIQDASVMLMGNKNGYRHQEIQAGDAEGHVNQGCRFIPV
jgi:ferric enterobactin receptor